ncbi:hypothetical protein JDY09_00300 [Thermoleophilum album]|uniref:hypothetical protein n=1 Tax=Thermoleophilum album TaxID=29539 RepID=UPI00237CF511|nr:hypothetical protein [Thermoleophilum album]WDT93743.1 hypothetical protein JDY09_00300 [Thermoleophilum album]
MTIGILAGVAIGAVPALELNADIKIAAAIGAGLLAEALFLDLRERNRSASGAALSTDGRMPSLPRVRPALIYLLASLAFVGCLTVVLPPASTPLPVVAGSVAAWLLTRSIARSLRAIQ